MQKLKQTGIALMVAGLLSANAWASEAAVEPVTAQPVAAFTDADLNALFEQEAGKPMQLAVLSGQEMRETEGAIIWMPLVWAGARMATTYVVRNGGFGALGGALNYGGSLLTSRQGFNSNRLGGALAGGFVGGLLGGNNAFRSGTLGMFGGGFTQGLFSR